ncbi:hypothetical protein ACA910_009954 [Epithemia clementina (nom. ined.)]
MRTALPVSLLLAAMAAIPGAALVGETATALASDETNDNSEDKGVHRIRSSNRNKINNDMRNLIEGAVVGSDGSCIFDVPKNKGALFSHKVADPRNGIAPFSKYKFDSMVAFGDNLCDIGTRKYFAPCTDLDVKCNNPRTGDGPLFVDYLAAYFNVAPLEVGFTGKVDVPTPPGGSNFARSGAFARRPVTQLFDSIPRTGHFFEQINNYKAAIGLETVEGFTANLAKPTKSRLHVVWIGSSDYISALVLRLLLISATAPDPNALVALAVAGIKEQLNAMYIMDDVCNVLVLGPTDGKRVKAGALLDPKYPNYATKYEKTILEDVRAICVNFNNVLGDMIATDLATIFEDKCKDNKRGFGIKFVNTVEVMDDAFPFEEYPLAAASCNNRTQATKAQCDAAANGVFVSLKPGTPDSESDGLCTNPVFEGKECDCTGLMNYDELQVSGEFHKKFFQEVIKSDIW